jgi:hypothetical protein
MNKNLVENLSVIHAITETVNRHFPIVAIRVRGRFNTWRIYGEQSGTWTGFLPILRFPLPITSPTALHTSSIIRGWHNRQNSGRRTKWSQSHPTPQ